MLTWRGNDLSFIPQLESTGLTYAAFQGQTDPVRIQAAAGLNLARIRIWVNPSGGWCDLAHTVALAQRAKAAGMDVFLDLHYSDSWADPGQQTIPAAWSSLSYNNLKNQVYQYTRSVTQALVTAGVTPRFVQIGNEVTSGMLWPHGRITDSASFTKFVPLFNSGVDGLKSALPVGAKTQVVLHIDRGGDQSGAQWYFDQANANGAKYDVIGLSFYSWWHGTVAACEANLRNLASRYTKPILLAEVGHPWTLAALSGGSHIVGPGTWVDPKYPANKGGQQTFIVALSQILTSLPNKKGLGMVYWAGDWVHTNLWGDSWENVALFDQQRKALPALTAFAKFQVRTVRDSR